MTYKDSPFDVLIGFWTIPIYHIWVNPCFYFVTYLLYPNNVIIKGITALQDMGIDCENIECFSEALALKEAEENYGRDSLDYDSYKENLLEKTSNQYAEKMVEMLQSKGYLK